MTGTLQRLREAVMPRLRMLDASRVPEFAFAFLFATSGRLGFAPLGPATVAGAWLAGRSPFPALFGVLVGALVAGNYSALAAAALYMGAGLLVSVWRGRLRMPEKFALLGAAFLVLLPFFHIGSAEDCLIGVAELVLAGLAAAVVARGGAASRAFIEGRSLRGIEQISLLLFAALCAAALPRLQFTLPGGSPFGTEISFYFGAVFAAFVALCAVRARGAEGVAAAVLLGAACMLQGADIGRTGALSLAALCAAAFVRAGKWGIAGGFLAAWAAAAAAFALPASALVEAGIGALCFALLPRRYLQRLAACSARRARSEAERTLALTRAQLRSTADVIRAVSEMFSPSGDENAAFTHRQLQSVSGVIERLAEETPAGRHCRLEVRVGAAGCPKAGNDETGDSMGMRRIGGELLLLLSDGMGTGSCAHRESAAAVAIFGDLLSVGFAPEEAQECVNRLLMIKGEREMYATLDALLIDLADGRARFIKYGAPPAYILRGGRVHTVYAEALPIGILPEAQASVHELALRRGDAVILMTDGLFDALGTELFAALIERVGGANTVDDAASALLAAGQEKSGADDMSVLVARVC